MFLPFKSITNRQSAAYAVLCVALMAGINYLDKHTPERNPLDATRDNQAWSEMDARGEALKRKRS